MDPALTADEYAKACAEWGFETFASVAEAGRLADLLGVAQRLLGIIGVIAVALAGEEHEVERPVAEDLAAALGAVRSAPR